MSAIKREFKPDNRTCLEKFKSLHEQVRRGIDENSIVFIRDLCKLIRNWEGELPNLRDILRPEEIDWLLTKSMAYSERELNEIIDFVIRTGYKDEPDVDYEGKPWLRRTTQVHHVARREFPGVDNKVRMIFKIYDRFDVNYTDESGLTHYHAACASGCYEIFKKFFELVRDPNLLVGKTGNSPLHFALRNDNKEVIEFLLRNGADPTWANKDGLTPLHFVSEDFEDYPDVAKMLFEMSEEKYRPVQVDAQDNEGMTPLHFAVNYGHKDLIEFLLRNGANPNIANAEGATPLHVICKDHRFDDDESLKQLLEISNEIDQLVQVDALDNLGRTPLQWAVANLLLNDVDVLLDNGADLSNFVFPTDSYFAEGFKSTKNLETLIDKIDFKFRAPPRALVIVQRLEERGYQLDRIEALMIMKFFAKYELFEKSTDFWIVQNFKEWLVDDAKRIMIKDNDPSLTFYDLVQMRPEEAEKLVTYEDYLDLAYIDDADWPISQSYQLACVAHICEKLSKGFFRRWTLEFFLELTRYELPILCCEIILKELMNEDLCNVCLAATGQHL